MVPPLVWLQCLYCVFGCTIVRGWSRLDFSFNLAATEVVLPAFMIFRSCKTWSIYHSRSKLITPAPFHFIIQSPSPRHINPWGSTLSSFFNFPPRRMTRVELPVFSFLAVLSLLFILPLHLRSRNIPFLFVIAWLLVCNIIQGIDAIVWAKDAVIRAEGWCDSGESFSGRGGSISC